MIVIVESENERVSHSYRVTHVPGTPTWEQLVELVPKVLSAAQEALEQDVLDALQNS